MSNPQFDTILDALVTTLQAATGLGVLGDGTSDTPVVDGPFVTDDQPRKFLIVGSNGSDDETAVSFNQDWANIGYGSNSQRDEELVVDCFLKVWDGSDNYRALRTTAGTVLGYVSDALRALPALSSSAVLWSSIGNGQVLQGVAEDGAEVSVVFQILVHARI